MKLMKIGKIVNTFGIKGELRVLSDSDFVEERFKVNNTLYLADATPLIISGFRFHNNNILIKINNHDDINAVEKYKNQDIFIDQTELQPLEEGYYLFQLEALKVYVDNEFIGDVIEVLKPAQTVLRVKTFDREILIPFVDEFILDVDLDNKRIDVKLIEGM